MATICVGDLHGCYDEFRELLSLARFDPGRDRLLIVGDLVGRGPRPLETVRYLMSLGTSAQAVLGNHDLHFLAAALGHTRAKPSDQLEPLLNAPDLPEIVTYFAGLPLVHLEPAPEGGSPVALIHAGLYPAWKLPKALKCAREVERMLRHPKKRHLLLAKMYGDSPDCAHSGLKAGERRRFTINACTRMRWCRKTERVHLDAGHSSLSPEDAPALGLKAWFELLPQEALYCEGRRYTLVFGHWAALQARCAVPGIVALDTGCVWGGQLSAWVVESGERLTVPAHQR